MAVFAASAAATVLAFAGAAYAGLGAGPANPGAAVFPPEVAAQAPAPEAPPDAGAAAADPSAMTVGEAAATPCALASGAVDDYMFEGQPRSLKLVVPEGASAASPVYVSLHAAFGSAESQEAVSGLSDTAGIVMYPEAIDGAWVAAPNSADVRFVAELIASLHRNGCGSPATTSVSGWSMGAMLTARLLCSRPDLFTSAAMVGGVLPPTAGCEVPAGTSILVVHGVEDRTVSYDGSLGFWLQAFAGGQSVSDYPGMDRWTMAEAWQEAKGCPAAPRPIAETDVVEADATACGTAPTRAIIALTGGHTWDPPGYPGMTTARIVEMANRA